MQDGTATADLTKNPTFDIERSTSLSEIQSLLRQLARNEASPQPAGATFSTAIFEDPSLNAEFKVNLSDREIENNDGSIIDRKQLSLILSKIRTFLLEYDESNKDIAKSTDLELDGKIIKGGEFLFRGLRLFGIDDQSDLRDQDLKDTLNLLLQLVAVLNSGETAEQNSEKIFIAAQIPEELQRYVSNFNLEDWKTIVFPIIQQLHKKVATYSTVQDSSTTLEHTFPDYRKFINAWIKKAFETKDPKLTKYFDLIKEETRKKLQFADSHLLAIPLQKSAEDERALNLLYEKFNKVVEAIIKENEKEIKVALKEFVSKEDLEGGGGESDASEEDQPDEDEKTDDEQQLETISINDAEATVKEGLYQLLLKNLEIEEQIEANDFLTNLPTNGEKIVFREQIRTELYLQIIDTVNIRPQLTSPDAPFHKEGLIYEEAFLEQVDALIQAAFFNLSSDLTTKEKGFEIITVAYQFAKMTTNEYVKEDLTAPSVSDDTYDSMIAALPPAFVSENNIESFQDLKDVPPQKLLLAIKTNDELLYEKEKRRLENVFLSYLQNNGADIKQLSELDYGLQLSIGNELDAYFATLTSEEIARLFIDGDSSFRLIAASRLNRELLLGRFQTTRFYADLHTFTQQKLSEQQKSAQADINQVLQNNGQNPVDLTKNSPEEIDRMSVKEFQKAFPNLSIPDNITADVFARYKQQAIESWTPPNSQQAIIQSLMVAYGSDTSFIYTLDSVDKINLVFGLNLPESLTDQDLALIQQSLQKYWQFQIEKTANERNFYLNQTFARQQGLQDQDSNSENVRTYTTRITSRTFTPIFSQTTQDAALLAEQAELLNQAQQIGDYNFRLYLTEQELLAQQENVWNERTLIALSLLQQDQALAEQQTLAGIMQAQITSGYQQQGRMGGLARRFGRNGKRNAKATLNKAKKQAVQQAASALHPALGVLNKVGDTIENITGLSKTKQVGALIGGTIALLLSGLEAFFSNIGGMFGGIIGGAAGGLIGSAFGPAGTIAFGSIGFSLGSHIGKGFGSQLPGSFGLPSAQAGATGLPGANAASALAKVNPLTTTAGFTIGTFTIVTAATALITHQTINSALLLPTISGENNEISKFVVIEKQSVEGVSFDNGDLPNPITYTVRIRANESSSDLAISEINISDITDTLSIRSKDESVNGQDKVKSKTDFGYDQDEIITLLPGESIELEYTQSFEGTVTDASIDNRFEIAFSVTYSEAGGPEQTEEDTAFTAETICVGDCPASEGCWPASGLIYQLPFNKEGAVVSHNDEDAFDIAAATGTDVYAPFAGSATKIVLETGYGNHIKLFTNEGYNLLFGHLSAFDPIFDGATTVNVSKGQRIGAVGSTGNSTGSHLHYGIAINNQFFGLSGNSIADSLLATVVPDGLNTKLFLPVRACGE